MSGSAMLTIVMSISSMKMPVMTATRGEPLFPPSGGYPAGLPACRSVTGANGRKPQSPCRVWDLAVRRGWSSQVARRAHNPKVAGSNPAPLWSWNRSPSGFQG